MATQQRSLLSVWRRARRPVFAIGAPALRATYVGRLPIFGTNDIHGALAQFVDAAPIVDTAQPWLIFVHRDEVAKGQLVQ